jgi:hypothetical protein
MSRNLGKLFRGHDPVVRTQGHDGGAIRNGEGFASQECCAKSLGTGDLPYDGPVPTVLTSQIATLRAVDNLAAVRKF